MLDPRQVIDFFDDHNQDFWAAEPAEKLHFAWLTRLQEKKMRKRFCLSVAIVGLAAATPLSPASAVTVTDLTTNTVLFHDDFEGGLSANSPSVGTWGLGPNVTATNTPVPGPAQGSSYAQLFRNTLNTPGEGNLQAQLAATPALGDVIKLSFLLYLPSATAADAQAQLMLDNGDFGSARAWFRPDGSGNVIAIVGPGFATISTGLHYSPDTWQEWDLQYAIGASTFDLSVNGVSASGFSSPTVGPVNFADLFNGVGNPNGSSVFLDALPQATNAVPEPSTWAMMILGFAGIGLMAYRKSKNGLALVSNLPAPSAVRERPPRLSAVQDVLPQLANGLHLDVADDADRLRRYRFLGWKGAARADCRALPISPYPVDASM